MARPPTAPPPTQSPNPTQHQTQNQNQDQSSFTTPSRQPIPSPQSHNNTEHDSEPRVRTRGIKSRLPLHPLSHLTLRQALRKTTPGTRIRVRWAQLPDPDYFDSDGSILSINQSGDALVKFDDPHIGTQPMPSTNESIIYYDVQILGVGKLHKPIHLANNVISLNCPTIYLDGGAAPSSGGPGAAAISIHTSDKTTGTLCVNEHSRFYPRVTNNISEK